MDFTLLYSSSPCHAPCALDAACNLAEKKDEQVLCSLFPCTSPFCAHFYRGFLLQILIDKARFALVESAARQSLWNFYYIVFHFLHGAVNSWNQLRHTQQREQKNTNKKRVANICKADSSNTRRIRNVFWNCQKAELFLRASLSNCCNRSLCSKFCCNKYHHNRVELPAKFIMRPAHLMQSLAKLFSQV